MKIRLLLLCSICLLTACDDDHSLTIKFQEKYPRAYVEQLQNGEGFIVAMDGHVYYFSSLSDDLMFNVQELCCVPNKRMQWTSMYADDFEEIFHVEPIAEKK